MSRRRKVLFVSILGVVGLVAVARIAAGGDRGVEVRVEEIRERDLISTVTATGSIRARRSVDISSDVMGRVVELLVEEGQEVERGDVLLHLDPTQFRAQVSRAQAALSQSRSMVAQERANLVRAERELNRVAQMRDSNPDLVSRQQIEDAETQVEIHQSLLASAEHGVEQAQASLEEAMDELEKTTIRAPMAGTVTRLDIEEGETAVVGTMNNPGSLLLTIGDLALVEAVMTVDETDLPRIDLGDSAAVEVDAYPGSSIRGTVTKIGNSAIRRNGQSQGSTVEFEVILALENPAVRLRPDLSATADIIADTRQRAVAVPIIAVTVRDRDGAGDRAPDREAPPLEAEGDREEGAGPLERGADDPIEGVFVVRDGGIARFTPVELGITGREHFEVLSGLELGDTVVRGPYQVIRELRDGDRVRPAGGG